MSRSCDWCNTRVVGTEPEWVCGKCFAGVRAERDAALAAKAAAEAEAKHAQANVDMLHADRERAIARLKAAEHALRDLAAREAKVGEYEDAILRLEREKAAAEREREEARAKLARNECDDDSCGMARLNALRERLDAERNARERAEAEVTAWKQEAEINDGYAKRHAEEADCLRRAASERDALAAFKTYVHARLDAMGIPTHPDGPHSKEGCRVGDRLDMIEQRAIALAASGERMRALLEDARFQLGKVGARALSGSNQIIADIDAALSASPSPGLGAAIMGLAEAFKNKWLQCAYCESPINHRPWSDVPAAPRHGCDQCPSVRAALAAYEAAVAAGAQDKTNHTEDTK